MGSRFKIWGLRFGFKVGITVQVYGLICGHSRLYTGYFIKFPAGACLGGFGFHCTLVFQTPK